MDVLAVERALIGCNVTYLGAVQGNLTRMRELFGGRMREMRFFADDPVQSALNILGALEGVFEGGAKRVVMDITCFTRETLLMLLWALRNVMRKVDTIEFLYVAAREYASRRRGADRWLSKGILEVRSVLGFPGRMRASQPTHMIVMVGFEFERAAEIVRVCEPSVVSLGFSHPGEIGAAQHQGTNEEVVERLRRVLGNVGSFRFRAYDAAGAREDLLCQMDRFGECNVVITPMHTKISTLGAALVGFEREKVQLCYAPAKIYNVEDYSVAGDYYYRLTVPEFERVID